MGEKMPIEKLRDRLRELSMRDEAVTNTPDTLARWADIVDAHLTQPAQAVDVEKVREERDSQQRAAIAAIDRAERAEALLRDVLDSYCASPALHKHITVHLSENSRG